MSVKAVKSYVKNGSSPLRAAVRAVVEHLEGRQLMAADPFANEGDVQSVPFVLDFDGSSTSGLHDKDGEHIGFTRLQVNKNGRTASYVQGNLDQAGGLLKITTTGSSTSGSNFNGDNTLTNAVETTFNGSTSGFVITTRLVGPLSYINEPSEQAGLSFGPDQDNYVKLVAVSRAEGPRLQFVDEQPGSTAGTFVHGLDVTRDVGSFGSVNTLDLRLVGDAATGKVSAFYSVNGGAYTKFTQELTLTGARKAAFFSANAKAGLLAAHKNNTGAITASFDRFEIQPGTPVAAGRPSVASVTPANGTTHILRDQFVSAQVKLPGGGIASNTLNSGTVRLYRTSDQQVIPANVGTSGGGDIITLKPYELLQANTSYTFEVSDGVLDVAGNAFVPFTSTFTTGTAGGEVDGSFSFEKVALNNATGEEFTALKVGPDRRLYAGTVDGRIFRFAINANGTLGSSQLINVVQQSNGGNKRLLTGLAFDPASTAANPILWVTHGQYRFGLDPDGTNDEQKYADDWTGKISKVTNLGGGNTGTLVDVVRNLPRSARDHLTNQPSFGPDNALYIPQGSNSAGGRPDNAWGNRPERQLTAAILRLDPTKVPAGTTLDAKTSDGGGSYNPFAANAALTIYATGVRNAFDLVWTSDDKLYAPTNGTAAGANTPSGPGVPALTDIGAQHDFLFNIVPGGYYGHPNPTRQEYVHGGGYTPDDGFVDANEVPEYGSTVQPDPDYKGYAYDFDLNISPNGVIEYQNAAAFNGALKGKLIVARYSGPDDLIVLTRDPATGAITRAQKGIPGLGGFIDPLDVTEDPASGNLYVSEYSERDPSRRKITLLRPVALGGNLTASKPRLVFTDIATGNTGGSASTAAQSVTIKNTGTQPLTIQANGIGIVDDVSVGGTHNAEFQLVSPPSTPTTIAAGDSITVQVRFTATSVGLKAAQLRVQSNATNADLRVNLRGIGTASDGAGDVSGTLEPSLQRILTAFEIPVNVGDADGEGTTNFQTPRPAGTAHDEVAMPRLLKAGAGPVTIETLAAYQFNNKTGPVTRFGYYAPGTKDAKTELFTIALDRRASTTPGGGASFDPGSAAFALYNTFNGSIFEDANKLPRTSYSEDALNTWAANTKQKFRFFPLKNPDGSTEPNAFVFTTEDFDGTSSGSFDNNDLVGVIRNVKAAPAGPEVGTQNVDRQPSTEAGGALAWNLSPTRLSFNRIQQQPPDPVRGENGVITQPPNNVVHDTAKVRVRNSGDAPLTINSLVLSNTTHFQLVSPPAAGTVIAAGGFVDVTVKFIATSAATPSDANGFSRNRVGTLTINTNDADEGATKVDLVGYWQSKSENNEEPTLPEFMQLFGYGTRVTYDGEVLHNPNDPGRVRRVGDEVLSPFWRRADAAQAVEVVQLAAYHSQGSTATAKWHYASSFTTSNIFVHDGEDGQSVLPRLDNGSQLAAGTFKPATQGSDTNPAFGFRFDNEWSDPTRNPQELGEEGRGHHVRFWVAKDLDGNVIPNTYLVGMDYLGINYDYQDNLYVVRNIKPVSGPSAPANAVPTASGAGIALDWNDNGEANLAGYNVYRGTASGFTPSSANRLNDGGLLTQSDFNDIFAPSGVTSYYAISAVDTSGNESGFARVSAARTADTTAPSVPAGLTVVGSASGITLDWADNAEADLAGYDVSRATSANGTYTKLNTSGLLTTSTFVDATAQDGVTYFYRVVAKDQSGNTSAAATGSGARGASQGPGVPGNLDASGTGQTTASLTWGASSGATSYRVERMGPTDASFVEIAVGITTTTYNDTGLTAGTTYQYRVRAENGAGQLSGYSNTDAATTESGPLTAPQPPANFGATPVSSSQVNLSWNASAGAASYRIERRVLGAASFDEIAAGVTATSYQDAGRDPGTTYEYRVRAENSAGLSGYSTTATATTPAPSAYVGTAVGTTGSHTTIADGSAYDVTAAGAGVTGTSDQFYFLSRGVTGDFDVKLRVDGITGGNNFSRAGIMARSSLAANSANAFVSASLADGFRTARRLTDGGSTTTTKNGTPAFPNAWVRLQRVGNTFSAYYGSNGTSWTQIFTQSMALPQTLQLGLASSGYGSASANFRLRDFGDTAAAAPAPGIPGTLGATPVSSSQIDLAWGAGTNAAGYRVERKGPGDADFVQIASVTGTSYSDTNRAANTTYEYRVRSVSASGTVFSAYGNTASATTQPLAAPAAPGNLDAVAASPTQVNLSWNASSGAASYRVERRVLGAASFDEIATGVTVTSYQDTGRTPETTYEYRVRAEGAGGLSGYSNVDGATTPPATASSPYTGADVASTRPGSTTARPDGTSFDITAGGSNIQGTADSFHFAYRALTGDFDVKGQLSGLVDTDGSPKAGFMARTDLSAGSANVFSHVASNGYRVSRRATPGANTDIVSSGGLNAYPNTWLRLRRSGNTFTAFRSTDGTNWTTIGTYTQAMPGTLLVGMAVTAQSTTQATTAAFRSVGDVTTPPPPPPGPAISVSDVTKAEGNSGTTPFEFTATRTGDQTGTNLATFTVVTGTADANDVVLASGQFGFGPGETAKPIVVNVKGDLAVEPDEAFRVVISAPTNGAAVGDGEGVGTIVNDDSTAAPKTLLRVDAGSTSAYTDTTGKVWAADTFYTGGGANAGSFAVANTSDDALYYTRRTGDFSYSTPVDNGNYTLRLLFADPNTSAGQRKFDVSVEGQQVLNDFDIVAEAGSKAAVVKSFPVTVGDGVFAMSFQSVVGFASLSSFELVPLTT